MNDYLRSEPIYERAMLVQPGLDGAGTRKALQATLAALTALSPAQFDHRHISNALYEVAAELAINAKPLLGATSVAITGKARNEDNLFVIMEVLGKERVCRRITKAIGQLMVVA